jgi:hypothetical protein
MGATERKESFLRACLAFHLVWRLFTVSCTWWFILFPSEVKKYLKRIGSQYFFNFKQEYPFGFIRNSSKTYRESVFHQLHKRFKIGKPSITTQGET